MSVKPILFNTEMVCAISEGRKTVTRRPLKLRYKDDEYGFNVITNAHTGEFVRVEKMDEDGGGIFSDGTERYVSQPAYKGDILWVRETWRPTGTISNPYAYRATERDLHLIGETGEILRLKYRWHPSIHMPKEAARIWLLVKNVRVERLQDIDCAGARAEGCDGRCECPSSGADGSLSCVTRDFSIERFETMWDSTIKPAQLPLYGWDANPWVWVIEFERCDKPEETTK